MKDSLIIRIFINFLCLIFIMFPFSLHADEIDSTKNEIESLETLKHMTPKEMNDLFGEDPYLGQTTYLQYPEGFSQREN